MEHNLQQLIASARQVMDVPDEEPLAQNGPPALTVFALAHIAVFLYLAIRALLLVTALEKALIWGGTIGLAGLLLSFLFRRKLRMAAALAKGIGGPGI